MEILYGGFVFVAFLVFGLILWRGFGSIFSLLLPFVYGYITIFLSCLYLEMFPSFVYEQRLDSFFNGSSLVFFIIVFASIFSAVLVFQLMDKVVASPQGMKPLLSVGFLFAIFLLEIVLISHVFWSGSPLTTPGVTKFTFWREQAVIGALSIFNWALYPILFLVGANGAFFLYFGRRVAWWLSLLVLLLACFYYVSWGNKFSALLLVVFFYFIPGVISFRNRYGSSYPLFRRTLFLGVVFLFCVGVLVSWQYEKFQSRGLSVQEQLIERVLVLQGHVWWGAFNKAQLGADYGQALQEFESVFGGRESGEYGMPYIMSRLAPADLYSNYLESGVEFTGGYPAILLLIFGFVGGGVVSMLLWACYGFFLFYLHFLICSGSRIRLFLSSYAYMASFSWFQHGTVASFVNWKLFLVCFFLILLEVLMWGYGLNRKSLAQRVCNV